MIDGLGVEARNKRSGDPANPSGIEFYHVNARLSGSIDQIAKPSWRKIFLLLRYCVEAIGCRFRYGVKAMYYIPAPGLRAALYRDWIVMVLCRPFFRRIVFHWHAVGLGEWLEKEARPWEFWFSHWMLGRANTSIVLSDYNRADAAKLSPRCCAVVPNGTPDPCPDFANRVLPVRRARLAMRRQLLDGQPPAQSEVKAPAHAPHLFRVLFLSLCTREKGLFDCLDAIALANAQLAAKNRLLRVQLTVAGAFFSEKDRTDFAARTALPDLKLQPMPNVVLPQDAVVLKGPVSEAEKWRLFQESDCFCFPTYYLAEGVSRVLLEAMAFGLPIIVSRWRALPDLFPKDYPGLVEPRDPAQLALRLIQFLDADIAETFRAEFTANYTLEKHLARLIATLKVTETCH